MYPLPRKVKIVCTLGPASNTREVIRGLIEAGMDVARINASHGDHEQHRALFTMVREEAGAAGKPVAVLYDLQGPKIRTGKLDGDPFVLKKGEGFIITTDDVAGTREMVSTDYKGLTADVTPGGVILIDDGAIRLRVNRVAGNQIHTEVVEGGLMKSRKGISVPGSSPALPPLTPKDIGDLRFGAELGVDYIAVSFVRRASDLAKARAILDEMNQSIPLVAKLEHPESVDNLEEILDASDVVMVARGDMGVEISTELVPILQKRILRRALVHQKPTITATQMLESMTEHSQPTRAEASDVANAVLDGTDAVMLSAETASGKYPIEAVSIMSRIIEVTEKSGFERARLEQAEIEEHLTSAHALGDAGARIAREIGAAAMVVFTHSGYSARLLSRYDPPAPIYAFTLTSGAERRMSLYWGVYPDNIHLPEDLSTDGAIQEMIKVLKDNRLVRLGDEVVVMGRMPLAQRGRTNMIKIQRVTR